MTVAESLSLRPYQIDALDALRAKMRAGKRRLVLVAPTGSGKTVVASAMVRSAVQLGRRVLFLAHRRELIAQAVTRLAGCDVRAGVIMAGEPATPGPVQVASVQTLASRRLGERCRKLPPADLVIVDECHHSTSASWRAILDDYPEAFIIGLTATPWRTDRVGLRDLYEDSVVAATPAQLISGGALCPYEAFAYDAPDLHSVRIRAGEFQNEDLALACNTAVLVGNVVKEYQAHTPGRPALVFAVNVDHSQALVDEFNAAGVPALHVDYNTTAALRAHAVESMRSGHVKVLSSVSLFSEGFDLPMAEVCIMARPTMSPSLHLQMQGRVMRPATGKQGAVIHDHGGNLLRHGLLDEERDYSLTATPRRVRELHTCPFCRAAFGDYRDDGSCPKCGEIIAPPREVREANERREKEKIEGERLNAERVKELRQQRAASVPRGKQLAYFLQLQDQAHSLKYKAGWAAVRFKLRYGSWPNFTSAEIAEARAPRIRAALDRREEMLEQGCTCFLGHPPCAFCTREATA